MMSMDTEHVSAVMGIVLKVALTAFMGIISYAFNEIKTTAKETQQTVGQHMIQLAILENNYKEIDKKLGRIADSLDKQK